MSTEEGAFLRGQIQMEEKVHLGITQPVPEVTTAENGSQEPRAAEQPAAEADERVTSAASNAEQSKGATKFKRKEKGKSKS
jgi:hypothetical protein